MREAAETENLFLWSNDTGGLGGRSEIGQEKRPLSRGDQQGQKCGWASGQRVWEPGSGCAWPLPTGVCGQAEGRAWHLQATGAPEKGRRPVSALLPPPGPRGRCVGGACGCLQRCPRPLPQGRLAISRRCGPGAGHSPEQMWSGAPPPGADSPLLRNGQGQLPAVWEALDILTTGGTSWYPPGPAESRTPTLLHF